MSSFTRQASGWLTGGFPEHDAYGSEKGHRPCPRLLYGSVSFVFPGRLRTFAHRLSTGAYDNTKVINPRETVVSFFIFCIAGCFYSSVFGDGRLCRFAPRTSASNTEVNSYDHPLRNCTSILNVYYRTFSYS